MPTDDRDVLAANSAYYRAFEAADPIAMDAVWSGGPHDVCIHPAWAICQGPINVRNSYRRIFASGERLRIRLGSVRVDVHGEIGRVTAVEHISLPGEEGILGRVACTNLFVRTESGWRMILHHGSPISGPEIDPDPDPEYN